MGNIHKTAQRHMATIFDVTKYGDPVVLISPSGDIQNVSGSIVYTHSEEEQDGIRVIKNNPRVDIRLLDLTDIPTHGEKWIVRVPVNKNDTDTLVSHTVEGKPIRNDTHGIISLILRKVVQS